MSNLQEIHKIKKAKISHSVKVKERELISAYESWQWMSFSAHCVWEVIVYLFFSDHFILSFG